MSPVFTRDGRVKDGGSPLAAGGVSKYQLTGAGTTPNVIGLAPLEITDPSLFTLQGTNNSQVKCNRSGWFRVDINVLYNSGGTVESGRYDLNLRKNGSAQPLKQMMSRPAGGHPYFTLSELFYLAAGDYLDLYIPHTGLATYNSIDWSSFTITAEALTIGNAPSSWLDIPTSGGSVVNLHPTAVTHYDTTDWGPAQYRIVGDEVQLRGAIKRVDGTTPVGGFSPLQVAAGFIPRRHAVFPVVNPAAATAYWYVNKTTGWLTLSGNMNSNWIPLDHIRWSFA